MPRFFIFSLLCLGLLSTDNLSALATKNMDTPQKLAEVIFGNTVSISNMTFHGANDTAGTFNDGLGSIGLSNGIILSSGLIERVVGPNLSDGMHHKDHSLPGDHDIDILLHGVTSLDATVLEFDLLFDKLPDNSQTPITVTIPYVFASEEYNEYGRGKYTDVFFFLINGDNFALIPGTNIPISTATVNGIMLTSIYYRNNDLTDGGGSIDTAMDGLTVVLNIEFTIVPGQLTHIKIVIADGGNRSWDSNVFIGPASYVSKMIEMDRNETHTNK